MAFSRLILPRLECAPRYIEPIILCHRQARPPRREVRKAATLTEPFPRPRTGDRGYRNDTVVVSAYVVSAYVVSAYGIAAKAYLHRNRSKIGSTLLKYHFP